MYDYYFTFKSITGAQSGERLLVRNGVAVRLLRTPKHLSHNGCGYSLRVRGRDLAAALNLFYRGNVPYTRVFRVGADGTAEEVTP